MFASNIATKYTKKLLDLLKIWQNRVFDAIVGSNIATKYTKKCLNFCNAGPRFFFIRLQVYEGHSVELNGIQTVVLLI